jgi:hypothetical protein
MSRLRSAKGKSYVKGLNFPRSALRQRLRLPVIRTVLLVRFLDLQRKPL